MALRHPVEPEHGNVATPAVASEAASVREPFGAAQFACLAVGILFVALGAIGLARSGLDELTSPTADVWRMGMTPLLSLIHLVVGAITLGGAASRSSSRGIAMVIGPMLIAAGIVAMVEPIDELGWTETNGIVYLIAGGVAIAAAIMTPVRLVQERHVSAM